MSRQTFKEVIRRPALTGFIAATVLACFQTSHAATPGMSEQAVTRSLALIEAVDPDYGAVIALDPQAMDRARAVDRQRKARGPLYGEPILLKDNIESVGLPTTAGSLALASNDTGRDAPLVAALRQADAIILGKANLSEWANFRSEHSISGWSGVGGQTRNAHDRARSPCGSSSGSGVAVARGYVRIAIGTETSGSIVCPAAINGVVGFKPTHGLVSGEGIVPLALSQDTAGPITRDVEAAAKTLAVIANPAVPESAAVRTGLMQFNALQDLSGIRIGVNANSRGFDVRRDRALDEVLATLEALGATIVGEVSIERYDDFSRDSYDVLLYEFKRDLNRYLAALPNDLNTLTLERLIAFNEAHAEQELRYFDQSIFLLAQNLEVTEEQYQQKQAAIRKATREDGFERIFAENNLDAVIGVTGSPAWMIDTVNGDSYFGPGMAGNAAIAGNPHLTLPLAQVGGLPLGISLIGKRWEDHRVAQIGWLLEQHHPAPIYVAR